MNEDEIQILLDAWLDGCESERDTPEFERNFWAIDQVMWLRSKPNDCWNFILAAYKPAVERGQEACLTAGPIEDLLTHWGEQYIDRFVELAKKDECFNYVLGGVWHVTGMKDDVFAQIEDVRKQDWSWT